PGLARSAPSRYTLYWTTAPPPVGSDQVSVTARTLTLEMSPAGSTTAGVGDGDGEPFAAGLPPPPVATTTTAMRLPRTTNATATSNARRRGGGGGALASEGGIAEASPRGNPHAVVGGPVGAAGGDWPSG